MANRLVKNNRNEIEFILDYIYICSVKKEPTIRESSQSEDNGLKEIEISNNDAVSNKSQVSQKKETTEYYEGSHSSKSATIGLPAILFSNSKKLSYFEKLELMTSSNEVDPYLTATKTAKNGGAFEVIYNEKYTADRSLYIVVPNEESLSIWWESILDLRRKLLKFEFYDRVTIVYLFYNTDGQVYLKNSRKINTNPLKIKFHEKEIPFLSFLKKRSKSHFWIVSDFISDYWISNKIIDSFSGTKHKKIAFVSLLPRKMWPQTSLKFFDKNLSDVSDSQSVPLVSFNSDGILSICNYWERKNKSSIYRVNLLKKKLDTSGENRAMSPRKKVDHFCQVYSLNAKILLTYLACGQCPYTLRQIYILSLTLENRFESHNSLECVYGNLMKKSVVASVNRYEVPKRIAEILLETIPTRTKERIKKQIEDIVGRINDIEDFDCTSVDVVRKSEKSDSLIPVEISNTIDNSSNASLDHFIDNNAFTKPLLVSVIGDVDLFSKLQEFFGNSLNLIHYTENDVINANIESEKGIVLFDYLTIPILNIKKVFVNWTLINISEYFPVEYSSDALYFKSGVLFVVNNFFYNERNIKNILYGVFQGFNVFVSYGVDSSGEARRVIKYLEETSSVAVPFVNFKYDAKLLKSGDGIADFMKIIQSADVVLLVINDQYLYSEYAMQEFSGLLANSESLKGKVFPLVLDSAKAIIHDSKKVNALYTYWLNEKEAIEEAISKSGGDRSGVLTSTVEIYSDILEAVLSMHSFLNDFYYLPLETYRNDRFSPLFWEIDQRLKAVNPNYISVHATERDMRSALAREVDLM